MAGMLVVRRMIPEDVASGLQQGRLDQVDIYYLFYQLF